MDEPRDAPQDGSFPSTSAGGLPRGGVTSVEVPINLVKVFSATRSRERERLGDRVTDWIAENPTVQVVRTCVIQSSDCAFHCMTFVLFCFVAST